MTSNLFSFIESSTKVHFYAYFLTYIAINLSWGREKVIYYSESIIPIFG